MNNKTYVYIYLNQTKPGKWFYKNLTFDYEPFYVGVGINRRFRQHLQPKILSNNSIKSNIINKIIRLTNEQPIHYKIFENLTPIEAYEIEKDIIKTFGRINLKNGPLSNMTDGGESGTFNTVVTPNTRKKMSLKALNTKTYGNNGMSKIVAQYSLDGVLLNTFNSLREASESIDKDFKNISSCCRGKSKSAYGYKWEYLGKSYKPLIKPEVPSRKKKVYQYDLEGNFIAEYESMTDATKQTKINHISCVCLGKLNFSGGFQWKYDKFDKISPLDFTITKNINRYK